MKLFETVLSKAAPVIDKAKYVAPEVLVGIGVVGIGIGVYEACKTTYYKAPQILAKYNEDVETIEKARENADTEVYSEKNYTQDLIKAKSSLVFECVKTYGPSIAIVTVSIGSLVGSHVMLRKRMAAVTAAYGVLNQAFKAYRGNVIAEKGVEFDKMMRHGLKKIKVTEEVTDENGEVKKKKVDQYAVKEGTISGYSRFFDELNQEFKPNQPALNLMWLQGQQEIANHILRSRGYLFLNEVYSMLGYEETEAGQVVGWQLIDGKDGFVDFGITKAYRTEDGVEYANSRVFDGAEEVILLDFNVDGPIKPFKRKI